MLSWFPSSLKALYQGALLYKDRTLFIFRTNSSSSVNSIFGPMRVICPEGSLSYSCCMSRDLDSYHICRLAPQGGHVDDLSLTTTQSTGQSMLPHEVLRSLGVANRLRRTNRRPIWTEKPVQEHKISMRLSYCNSWLSVRYPFERTGK